MVATNDSTSLQLRLDVPANAAMGTQNLTVTAKGATTELTLPIAVTLAKDLPAKLTVEPQLPSLRGTSKSSFEYQLNVKNDSGRNLVVALGGAGAAELRDELHRAVRQPGADLDSDRGRPVQDRQAQGAAAEHDRRQPLSGRRSRPRPRTPRADATVALEITGQPQARHRRPRRRAERAAPRPARRPRSRSSSPTPAPRRPTRSSSPAARRAAGRSSSSRRPIDRIAPGAEQGSAGAASPRPRRRSPATTRRPSTSPRAARPPRTQFRVAVGDLDHVGHRRRRHHRDRAADHGRRGGEVRPAMSDTVIEAQGLTKRYGRVAAVDGISFTVGRGEIFGLLGPNGAGKTTTILMMLGLTDVTGGSVSVLGHDPVREPLQVKRRVGYLPDTVGFYDHMTALDNLRYTAALIGIDAGRARPADRRRARSRRPRATSATSGSATFSRGMRQRLGPCRNPDEGRCDRDPRRADLGPRSAGDRRAAGDDPLAQARRRRRAAVVASARARAERVRPRRAVQRRHASRCSAPCPSWRARCSAAATTSRSRPTARGSPSSSPAVPGVQRRRAVGPEPLPAAGRARRAAAGRRRRGQRRRRAAPAVGRGAVASTPSTTAISRTSSRERQHAA